ncbi:MAG TPA: hypothetical protein VNN18_10095 [Candidatus Xenobia bacterium]|nr:hypothetical protein [Candidatus Xenobia bacterium]
MKRPPQILPDQTWFWMPEWQAKEREADEALDADDYSEFTDVEELLASLKKALD